VAKNQKQKNRSRVANWTTQGNLAVRKAETGKEELKKNAQIERKQKK
jgi:hypothetical protein